MLNSEVCVLKTDGINCDEEMAYAFEDAGARPEIIHVNQLRSGEYQLNDFGGLAIPGGFSHGDDIRSGVVLGNKLTSFLSDQLQEFRAAEKPIIGICNGFQVLVATGLLPSGTLGERRASLMTNESGQFVCKWVDLSLGRSACYFIQPESLGTDYRYIRVPMQVAHKEGRFFARGETINELIRNRQIVFRYAPGENPNGSVNDIAGICDESGIVLGMMPHPERSIDAMHPYRVKTAAAKQAGQAIFKGMVALIQS